jgi:hypothetical protein
MWIAPGDSTGLVAGQAPLLNAEVNVWLVDGLKSDYSGS